jgi:hypothetical protein
MMRNYAKFKSELQKAVDNFNRKIRRVEKHKPELKSILPKKITAAAFREMETTIGSKRDFNRIKKRLQRFSKRGAEEPVTSKPKDKDGNKLPGITKTRWERNEAARTNAANEMRKRARRGAIQPSTETGTMGLAEDKQFIEREFNFNDFSDDRSFEKFVDVVERQVTDKYEQDALKLYKDNYLKAIADQLGSGEIAKQLYDYIDAMKPDKIFDGFNTDVDVKGYRRDYLSIRFTYGHDDKEAAAESILENWIAIADKL